jgi:RNA polymerase sigma factor (sigma-70 family)
VPHYAPDHLDSSRWVEALDDERAWLREFARGQIRGRRGDLESEDLVQEAHARGLAQRSKLRFTDRRSLRAWLALVVRNLVRDRQRKHRPENVEASKLDRTADSATSPSGHVVKRELSRILRSRLGELDPQAARIIKMRIWDERSFGEIGGALGINEGNARVTYHRSIKRLHSQLRPVSRESQ